MNARIEKFKENIPKKHWLKEISNRIAQGEIWQHSTFMTYYVLLTAFPLLVGIINGLQQFNQNLSSVIWFIVRIAPEPLAERLIIDLELIYERSNVGIFIFAIISTVWTVSWTMAAIIMGLNRAYGVPHRKNIVVLRILAFFLTLAFAVLIVLLALFIQANTTTSLGRWLLFFPAALFIFSLLYYVVPNVKQKYRFVLPGALFSTGALVIAIIGYRLFINQLPTDSTFFTLLGSFMVMLALLQKTCLAILAGGTINATIMHIRHGEVKVKGNDSKFVRFLRKLRIVNIEK